jgi:thiosulfate/3-mercaptopyruvate sulfurtransferase
MRSPRPGRAAVVLAMLALAAGGMGAARADAGAAGASGAAARSPLVSPAQLAGRLAQTTVVDVRPKAEFERGHIAGALRVDWEPLDPTRRTVAELAAMLGELGISDRTPVVVVGGGRSEHGIDGRVVWLLDWLGHDQVGWLDGGFARWQREGHAVATGPAAAPPPAVFTARPRPGRRATAAEVDRLRRQPGVLLLDVRTLPEFVGMTAFGAPRKGRIPGSHHLHWTDLLSRDDTVDTSDAARARLRKLGARTDRPVVVYCHSGVRAGAAAVALRVLGFREVLHYDASFEDWSRRAELPVER